MFLRFLSISITFFPLFPPASTLLARYNEKIKKMNDELTQAKTCAVTTVQTLNAIKMQLRSLEARAGALKHEIQEKKVKIQVLQVR